MATPLIWLSTTKTKYSWLMIFASSYLHVSLLCTNNVEVRPTLDSDKTSVYNISPDPWQWLHWMHGRIKTISHDKSWRTSSKCFSKKEGVWGMSNWFVWTWSLKSVGSVSQVYHWCISAKTACSRYMPWITFRKEFGF